METQKLTVRLPQDDLQFLKQFAVDHSLTVTELIRRQLANLRQQSQSEISPLLQPITGVMPQTVAQPAPRESYHRYLLDKHQ